MIETIGDLKKALEGHDEKSSVRTVFDAAGKYFFPHIALKSGELKDGSPCLIVTGEREPLEGMQDTRLK